MSAQPRPGEICPDWATPVIEPLGSEHVEAVAHAAARKLAASVLASTSPPGLGELRALLRALSEHTGVPVRSLLLSLVRFPDGAHPPSLAQVSSRLGALSSLLANTLTLQALLEVSPSLSPTGTLPAVRTRAGWAHTVAEFWHTPRTATSRFARLARAAPGLARLTSGPLVNKPLLAPLVRCLGQARVLPHPASGSSPAQDLAAGAAWSVSHELSELLSLRLLPAAAGAWSWDPHRGDPELRPEWAGEQLPEPSGPPALDGAQLREQLAAEFAQPDHTPVRELTGPELCALGESFAGLALGERFWLGLDEGVMHEFRVVLPQESAARRALARAEFTERVRLFEAARMSGALPPTARLWSLRALALSDPLAASLLRNARDSARAALTPEQQKWLESPHPASEQPASDTSELSCWATKWVCELPGTELAAEAWSRWQRALGALSSSPAATGASPPLYSELPGLLRAVLAALRRSESRSDALWLLGTGLCLSPRALLLLGSDLLTRIWVLRSDARAGLMNSAWARNPWLARLAPPRDAAAVATRDRIRATLTR